MAFHDNPIIDDNAHRSEESVNAVKSIFTTKHRFRCRDQYPDNGVDQNVELLDDQSTATGKLFGIQIKSTKSAKIVDVNGQPHLVWQFKTSRLGYLLRYAPPGYGLVVMYVEDTGKSYFDYADDIATRASEIRGNDDWRKQTMVDVHIPINNELTQETVVDIYIKLIRRFQNHDLLLSKHGRSYNIPVSDSLANQTQRFPLEKLEEFGIIYLVNENEFGKICQILAPYQNKEIAQFKRVCLFGTYAWMHIGHVFEAKTLLMRCKRFEPDFDSFEREIYVMTRYRLAWLAGDISIEEFGRQMDAELSTFKNPINIINVRLNLFFLKVSTLGSQEIIEGGLDKEFVQFFEEIEELDINEKGKHMLIMQHCEILSGYINCLVGEFALLINLRRKLGGSPLPEAQNLADRINHLGQVVAEKLVAASEYGEAADEKLIQAIALYEVARHFLQVQFNLAVRGAETPFTLELKADYQVCLGRFIYAYKQYEKEQHIHEAYLALHHAADTILLFRLLYKQELSDEDGEQLLAYAKELEDELGFKPYASQIEEGLRVTTHIREHPEESKLKDVTDEHLEIIARQILAAQQLPLDRLSNILSELKAYRRFDQECQNLDIELLSNAQNVSDPIYLYMNPPSYKLKSLKTGLETPPSNDIEYLLQMFQYLMEKT